ncbi:transcriptional antiterminator, BglG family [Granulicatella balaenopterae]|uniref:Transcriptional antiterminator, BglG family n=1 Tax=Granulicatella balaenopterae TaxID=137733 RepID=A0A1H9LNS7_9LACT|nr:HTH domain-containing protein [Granulicatella balaenopterae]SER12877.1 transcriptional antiterminator, BglG family [Granulicatella balaenopterae]
MFNSRQFQIVELLKNKNVSLKRISEIVKKSTRTVMRDINVINEVLAQHELGRIVFAKNQNGYQLEIDNEDKLDDVLKDWMNDEHQILYQLLIHDAVTIEELSEKLYLSSPVISAKLAQLKEDYRHKLAISVGKNGHYIKESQAKKVLALANLIYEKDRYFLKELGLDKDFYQEIVAYFNQHKLAIIAEYPYVSGRQFASIILAVYLLGKDDSIVLKDDSVMSQVFSQNDLVYTEKMDNLLSDYLDKVNQELARITKGTILDILLKIEERFEIKLLDMTLVKELVLHITRAISYSFIIEQGEIYNLTNLKAQNPFSFDISLIFANYLQQETGIEVYEADLLALYFICSMNRVNNIRQKIVIIGRHISLANINKNMIETNIPNVDVCVVGSKDALLSEIQTHHQALIINNYAGMDLTDLPKTVITVNQIISSKEISYISKALENILFKERIEQIFREEYAFSYQVKPQQPWQEMIEDISLELVERGCLNHDEHLAILEREKQDSFLLLEGTYIPHCMSKRKDYCVGAFVTLSQPVEFCEESIEKIIVVAVDPENKHNNNLFSCLYYAMKNPKYLEISSYQEFIALMKGMD